MKIKLKKINLLDDFLDNIPLLEAIITDSIISTIEVNGQKLKTIKSLTLSNKIENYIKGNIPKLEENEFRAIKSFLPYEIKTKLKVISEEVNEEIDLNVLNNSNDNQLSRYLKTIYERLYNMVWCIKDLSRIEEIKSSEFYYSHPLNNINTSEEYKKANQALSNLIFFDNFYFFYFYELNLEHIRYKMIECGVVEETEIKKEDSKTNLLSAFEIALKHQYLVKAKIEQYIIPKHVGEKYKDFANYKNIELSYSQLEKKPPQRKPNLTHLQNVFKSLEDSPEVQRLVSEDIDRL